jgi:hypothetical protein
MTSRRIARRIALSRCHQNTCIDAESGETLATKDMHYRVQFFPVRRVAARAWLVPGKLEPTVGDRRHGASAAGVRPSPSRGGARRVVSGFPAVLPLSIPSSLATKEKTLKEPA